MEESERLSRAFNGGGSPEPVRTLRESRGQDQSSESFKTIGLLSLSLIAVAVGVVTGIGAVAFRALIGFIHNVFFLGQFSTFYDANVYTPASPWGIYVIFVPVVGGLAVTFLVNTFAPEARGHGVPEVMDAIYYKEGVIRPVVAAVKSLASALSIGTGAAVGREGPIIQIGSSLGSTAGQAIAMAPWQRITLVGAGAGAGIAATFNTPIGGVMFAIELMMPEVSVRTFLPVALSTGAATFVGRFFLGIAPAFHVALPAESLPASIYVLLLYAFLGAIAGFGATAFIRGLHLAEDVFEHISNSYLRHAIGMLIVGVMIYVLFISLRTILCGGGRLCGDLGHPEWWSYRSRLARHPFHLQADCDIGEPRLRLIRRHFFARPFHGRDAGRHVWRGCCIPPIRLPGSTSPAPPSSAWPPWWVEQRARP